MSTSEANTSTDAKNEEPTKAVASTSNNGDAAMDVLAAAAAGEELAKTDDNSPKAEQPSVEEDKTEEKDEETNANGAATPPVTAEEENTKKDEDGDVEMQQSPEKDDEKKEEEPPAAAAAAAAASEEEPKIEEKKEEEPKEPQAKEEPEESKDEDEEMKDVEEEKPDGEPKKEEQAPEAEKSEALKPEEPSSDDKEAEPKKEEEKAAGESAVKENQEEKASAETESKPEAEAEKPADAGADADEPKAAKPSSDEKPKAAKPSENGSSEKTEPEPPVLRGTLSYNLDQRRHSIRGFWSYEAPGAAPPQRWELVRILGPDEDVKVLPQNGEFHGNFDLMYSYVTSKGKHKESSRNIAETGVKLAFTPADDDKGTFNVNGTGNNDFGAFKIYGTATPSVHDNDPNYNVILRKTYEKKPEESTADGSNKKKRKISSVASADGELPPPSQIYNVDVVALRGKLFKEDGFELGVGDSVHRITGLWSTSLKHIEDDPQNAKGLCNRFEYEHKSSVPSQQFPISGRYSGWFHLTQNGKRDTINEKDITLKFVKNSEGYYNVEGKGSNVFGKYTITGVLDNDNIITIFRHFGPPRKIKASRSVTAAPPPINTPGASRRPSLPSFPEPMIKLDDVEVEDASAEPFETFVQPEDLTYAAVSRGILKIDPDGSHSCKGKWAVSREHFTSGAVSSFNVRLEAHYVKEAMEASGGDRAFPLDSASYKGSFQLKKGGSRYQTIVDQQVVMKFRKNKMGSYNVYGRGVNNIGGFNLSGTLIMSGKNGGQFELYRMYPPELLAPEPEKPVTKGAGSTLPGPPPRQSLVRRESSRMVKAPMRLDEDDPDSVMQRIMEKCNHILRFMREKDVERGAFFSEPVDPVALGIPTYFQIISEPMDLRTLHQKMEKNEITTPEEFARLSRLIFENAMTFNVDPTHSVHQAARNLKAVFDQKFKDVERMMSTLRRSEEQEEKSKGKKRKRDEPKSARTMRLEEAKEMASANAEAMEALVAAAPTLVPTANVTRNEFNLLLDMIGKLQTQVVKTHNAVAQLSSDDIESGAALAAFDAAAATSGVQAAANPPEKKKQARRKSAAASAASEVTESALVYDDDLTPLTLKEQEKLTDTINELPAEHLHGVIQIIREAANLTDDEDEIDLEIDQLDTKTQRKLLKHVTKVSILKKSSNRIQE